MTSIGVYVNTWAGIERMLNTFIVQYHEFANGKLKENGFPSTLNEKIGYLATVSKDTRLPVDFRSSVSSWVERLGQQRDYRHMLIHGLGVRRLSYFEQEWTFQKLTLKGSKAKLDFKKFSSEELLQAMRNSGDLSHEIAQVLNPILFPDWFQLSSTNRP